MHTPIKFILTEKDIVHSIRRNPAEYTVVLSKIGLFISALLLVAHFALGVSIVKPGLLYVAIVAFSTYLLMGKKEIGRDSR